MKHAIHIKAVIVALLLCTLAVFGLVACDGGNDTADTTAAETTAPETPTEAPTETPTEAPTECVHEEAYKPAGDENHEKYCSKCQATLATDAHTWDEGAVTTEPTLDAEGVKTYTCAACGHTRTEAIEKLNIKDVLGLEINMADIKEPLMQSIFSGTTAVNETVMFLDKGDVKSLLYPIESIQSVTSYDGKKVYEEGKDYVLVDGKIQVTENSSIPCITSKKYYNNPGSLISVNHNGQTVPIHWGEGQAMTNWQVNVNYTHAAGWEGFAQTAELATYQNFVKKLQAGEDVTVFFYGDSITWGANASWVNGYAPHQLPYTMLFTQALADLFGYKVHYEAANLTASMPTCNVPADYDGGDRGTITYVNTAIGGWTSADGVSNLDKFVKDKINAYGCDLFVVAFGMNDAAVAPRQTAQNIETIVDGVLECSPSASIVLLSTMVPNPAGIGWYGNQVKQETQLQKLAEDYMEKGVPCAVSCMTSVSLSILEHKEFHDYSGNNINHPNDYFVRVYAQILLQTVIGYENMN